MTEPGFGACLHYLSGGSEHNASEYYGRKITKAVLNEKELRLTFEDGVVITLTDEAQSCCEERYITCDDDVTSLVGGRLVKIEAKDSGEKVGEYGDTHEWIFIEVATDQIPITLQTHNEHNGYYGGFGLSIKEIKTGIATRIGEDSEERTLNIQGNTNHED